MKIIYLTEKQYDELIGNMALAGLNVPKNNPYAFTLTIGNNSTIIYNNDCGLDDGYKQIVLLHERAHIAGIENEEDADRYALTRLNKKRKKILIENWVGRHGHEYDCILR
jgi:hypothetical protein